MTGTLLPADWHVKRNHPGPEGGECQAGQTNPRPRLSEHRSGDGKVVQERFVGPLAGRVGRQAIGRVGWRAEAWRCGEDPLVVENLSDDRRVLDLGRGYLQGIGKGSGLTSLKFDSKSVHLFVTAEPIGLTGKVPDDVQMVVSPGDR